MSEKKLRRDLIKLASEKPELRKDLLPLLRKESSGARAKNTARDLHAAWKALHSALEGAEDDLRSLFDHEDPTVANIARGMVESLWDRSQQAETQLKFTRYLVKNV